ncbi:MAG: OmpA family protein [Myxococcota bacterium]
MREGLRVGARAVAGALLTATLVLVGGAEARGQQPTSFAVEHFEPLHAQQLNILNIHGSEVVPHLGLGGSVMFHLADDALRLLREEEGQGDRELDSSFVHRQARLDLGLVFGLFDRLEVGVRMPFVLSQTGDDLAFLGRPGVRIDGSVAGDLRLLAKGTILRPDRFGGFGLALATTLLLPTGNDNSFNSDGATRFRTQLVMDWRHEVGFHVAANVGYTVRPRRQINNVVNDDEWNVGLGLEAPTGYDPLKLVASLHASFRTEPNLDPEDLTQEDEDDPFGLPAEVDGGLRWEPIRNLNVTAGGGVGLSEEISSPDWRVFAGVGWAPTKRDRDRDGIYDDADACPDDPEDFDGYQDADGCPDTDNDADGIPDVSDACPDDPEDLDGVQDDDGCPEEDADGDGILDEDDECPLEPETFNDVKDEDGCPDSDRDGDGIADEDDVCPDDPEDFDGVEDEDGCPDREDQKVKVTREGLEILQKVHFALDEATIRRKSHGLLEEVAQVLEDNPHITKLRIEGHTDGQGEWDYNMRLSQARAEAVLDYLVGEGVDADRLVAVGYGKSRPIATNDTSAGRAKNRRVEFTILEVGGEAVEREEGDDAPPAEPPEAPEESAEP